MISDKNILIFIYFFSFFLFIFHASFNHVLANFEIKRIIFKKILFFFSEPYIHFELTVWVSFLGKLTRQFVVFQCQLCIYCLHMFARFGFTHFLAHLTLGRFFEGRGVRRLPSCFCLHLLSLKNKIV